MIRLLVALSLLIATSCNSGSYYFEKDYYEKVTGIKFPSKYKVLETFDNGEWVTAVVLSIDSSALMSFVKTNHFDTMKAVSDLNLMGFRNFKSQKPDFNSKQGIFFINKSKNKNDWIYVADLNENKLWAEVRYPDFAGD
ncbi:hypothetical protein [Foetidibacter luteolus]|uniref:hypothetical protein n=1 Tax=Foetidibacter luteolus TaxID=2608880 RepID=UPI00129B7DC1|nr:hypothetical protein [Foetidibacter luteolus]